MIWTFGTVHGNNFWCPNTFGKSFLSHHKKKNILFCLAPLKGWLAINVKTAFEDVQGLQLAFRNRWYNSYLIIFKYIIGKDGLEFGISLKRRSILLIAATDVVPPSRLNYHGSSPRGKPIPQRFVGGKFLLALGWAAIDSVGNEWLLFIKHGATDECLTSLR